MSQEKEVKVYNGASNKQQSNRNRNMIIRRLPSVELNQNTIFYNTNNILNAYNTKTKTARKVFLEDLIDDFSLSPTRKYFIINGVDLYLTSNMMKIGSLSPLIEKKPNENERYAKSCFCPEDGRIVVVSVVLYDGKWEESYDIFRIEEKEEKEEKENMISVHHEKGGTLNVQEQYLLEDVKWSYNNKIFVSFEAADYTLFGIINNDTDITTTFTISAIPSFDLNEDKFTVASSSGIQIRSIDGTVETISVAPQQYCLKWRNNRLAFVDNQKHIYVWDKKKGEVTHTISVTNCICDIDWNDDGDCIAISCYGRKIVYKLLPEGKYDILHTIQDESCEGYPFVTWGSGISKKKVSTEFLLAVESGFYS